MLPAAVATFLDKVLHERAVEADEWRLVELALKGFRFRVPLPPPSPIPTVEEADDDWTGRLGGRGGGRPSADPAREINVVYRLGMD